MMSGSISRPIVVDAIRERIESWPGNIVDTMDDHKYHCQREEGKPEHKVIKERVICFDGVLENFMSYFPYRMQYLKCEEE